MNVRRRDPGPCPVDDAPHTTCCAPPATGPIAVVQLPARDGVQTPPLVGGVAVPPLVGAVQAAPLAAELVQATLPAGQFTSATYKRKRPV